MSPALWIAAAFVALNSGAVPVAAGSFGRVQQATANVRGTVLDAANGTPVADASVQIQGTAHKAKTDSSGRFELTGVPAGRQTVYVSLVGFVLVRRPIELASGETLDLTIALTEGTGTYSETVNVTTERFREQERGVPAK